MLRKALDSMSTGMRDDERQCAVACVSALGAKWSWHRCGADSAKGLGVTFSASWILQCNMGLGNPSQACVWGMPGLVFHTAKAARALVGKQFIASCAITSNYLSTPTIPVFPFFETSTSQLSEIANISAPTVAFWIVWSVSASKALVASKYDLQACARGWELSKPQRSASPASSSNNKPPDSSERRQSLSLSERGRFDGCVTALHPPSFPAWRRSNARAKQRSCNSPTE